MGCPGRGDDCFDGVPAGNGDALRRIFAEEHDPIHFRAQLLMRRERHDHTLQATALVDETFVRLAGSHDLDWETPGHFVALCAKVMRQILVDHAKSRGSLKRGGQRRRLPLDAVDIGLDADRKLDHEALNDALMLFESVRPEHAHVLELHYYGSLTGDEIARIVGRSPRTIDNWLVLGRNWLREQLE